MTTPDGLQGMTVAVTADRRRDEQAVLLERLGLEVLMFPLLRTEAEDTGWLRALSEQICRQPPDYFLANTGYGMRTCRSMGPSGAARPSPEPGLDDRGARCQSPGRGTKGRPGRVVQSSGRNP